MTAAGKAAPMANIAVQLLKARSPSKGGPTGNSTHLSRSRPCRTNRLHCGDNPDGEEDDGSSGQS
jgi:hypothetical protein